MTDSDKRIMEMCKQALELESRGMGFYEQNIAAAKTDVAKQIFTTLKKDEHIHQERIKKIYDQLEAGEPFSDSWKKLEPTNPELHQFFVDLAQKAGKDFQTDNEELAAIDVGIQFESEAVAFYEGYLKKAVERPEKDFIEKMIAEERMHHNTLTDMKLFYTDPAAWYREKEKGLLDGA